MRNNKVNFSRPDEAVDCRVQHRYDRHDIRRDVRYYEKPKAACQHSQHSSAVLQAKAKAQNRCHCDDECQRIEYPRRTEHTESPDPLNYQHNAHNRQKQQLQDQPQYKFYHPHLCFLPLLKVSPAFL